MKLAARYVVAGLGRGYHSLPGTQLLQQTIDFGFVEV
jgi:hypothetical protein